MIRRFVMHNKEEKSRETPYLSGGYLTWLVSQKKAEDHIADVNKTFSARKRDRAIQKTH